MSRPLMEVVHVSAKTSVGRTMESAAAAIRAGISRAAEHPFLFDRYGEPVVVSRVPWLSEELGAKARMASLVTEALYDTITPWTEKIRPAQRHLAVFLGLPELRPGCPADLAPWLDKALTAEINRLGWSGQVTCLPHGHASGLLAMERAQQSLAQGAMLSLAGGVDTFLEPKTLEWLDISGQLHSTHNAWGFVPGEGASMCLLATAGFARNSGLLAQGEILGIASAHEEHKIHSGAVCTGQALSSTFFQLFEGLAQQTLVDEVYCDLNAEPYRADEYGFAVLRTRQRFARSGKYVAPAAQWGDVGAASGPLLIGLACAAPRRGADQRRHALVWTSSIRGERCATLIRLPPLGE